MNISLKKPEKSLTHCSATRCNEQMQCGTCGTEWDVDDTDPPECKYKLEEKLKKLRENYRYCDCTERFDIQQAIAEVQNKLNR